MSLNLTTRLARLEAQQAPPAVIEISHSPGIRLLWLLLAVHAGDLQPRETVAQGVARALGYGSAAEMRATMRAEGTAFIEWNARHGTAVDLLLATRRNGPAMEEANEAAIRSLVADLPEEFRSGPIVDITDEAIRYAAEWVSL